MSARALRITLLVLTVIGVFLAAYLTYVHYSGVTPPCSTKGNPCSQVQKSRYSELIGIPVALIGLLGYIGILGSLLAPDGERARFTTATLTLGGFGFSAYLTYRELFTLHKICEWCVSSAVIMTIMVCFAGWRFLRGEDLSRPTPAGSEVPGPRGEVPRPGSEVPGPGSEVPGPGSEPHPAGSDASGSPPASPAAPVSASRS